MNGFLEFLVYAWWDTRCRFRHKDHHCVTKRSSATEKFHCLKCGNDFLRVRDDIFD